MAGSSQRTVVAVLLLLSAFTQPAWSKVALDIDGIYGSETAAKACLATIWYLGLRKFAADHDGAPNCLRLAFHDAGTYSAAADDGGANGSVLKEVQQLDSHPQHGGLQLCAQIMMPKLTTAARKLCPALTNADAIQVLGAATVKALGGPGCRLLMGRPDFEGTDDTARLPSPCQSAEEMVRDFADHGFRDPIKAVAVLSGAHTVGRARVSKQDKCNNGVGSMTRHPHRFDGHYYTEVVDQEGKKGWFASDRAIADKGAATAPLAEEFAAHHSSFLDEWCPIYQEMSLLGVDPAKTAGYSLSDGFDPEEALAGMTNEMRGRLEEVAGEMMALVGGEGVAEVSVLLGVDGDVEVARAM